MGHGAVISILLEHGADVNAKNHKGSTPLHMFCYGNPKAGRNFFAVTCFLLYTYFPLVCLLSRIRLN